MYIFAPSIYIFLGGQKTRSDPLELEFSMWVLEVESRSSAKAASSPNLRAPSPAPGAPFQTQTYKVCLYSEALSSQINDFTRYAKFFSRHGCHLSDLMSLHAIDNQSHITAFLDDFSLRQMDIV